MSSGDAPDTGGTILITGASGYLGRRLVSLATTRATVVAASRSGHAPNGVRGLGLDVTDGVAVAAALAELAPVAVIHAAAANPGADPHRFSQVNVGGSTAVAAAVAALGGGCRLVHVSTDVVHDGRQAPYDDDAAAHPLDAYGDSKARAEVAVLDRCPAAVVVRTSLIYGLDQPDRGTAGFAAALARGDQVSLFDDVWRQPVWVDSLAAALLSLALEDGDVRGRLNVAGRQVLSRAQFGRRLLDHWQIPGRDRVVEVSAAGRAGVPVDLRLHLGRATALGYELPGVDEVLSSAAGTSPSHRGWSVAD